MWMWIHCVPVHVHTLLIYVLTGVCRCRPGFQQWVLTTSTAPWVWKSTDASTSITTLHPSQQHRPQTKIQRHYIHHTGDKIIHTYCNLHSEEICKEHKISQCVVCAGHASPMCKSTDRILPSQSEWHCYGWRAHHGYPLLAAEWYLASTFLVLDRSVWPHTPQPTQLYIIWHK